MRTFKRILCMVFAVLSIVTFVPTSASTAKASDVAIGIDVSRWQGAIDWASVAASGVEFAFIRVGTAKSGLDSYFYYNITQAAAYGIKTGVYIYSYATTVEEAAAEAQFVIAALENVSVSYPVAFDMEDDVMASLSPDYLALMANTFCAIIDQAGYYPIVYSNKYWYTTKLGTIYYDKWVAQWNVTGCDVPGFAVWQYSATGLIPGIAGNVDLDFSVKDYSQEMVHTGWLAKTDGIYYYINYRKQRGLLDLGLAKYYLDANGRVVTGWVSLDDGVYYFDTLTGMMAANGLVSIDNAIYYFDESGKMQTGVVDIFGTMYIFGDDGKLVYFAGL